MSYARYAGLPRGHQLDDLRKKRLAGFIGKDQWQGINLLSVLYKKRYTDLQIGVYSPPDLTQPNFQHVIKQHFRPASKGEAFGPAWSTHWFCVTMDIPPYEETLEFHWDCNCEAMIWTESGEAVHGLTGGQRLDRRIDFIIPEAWNGRKTFFIEASMNGMFGCSSDDNDINQPPNLTRKFLLQTAELLERNNVAWDLYYDFMVISDIARSFPSNSLEAQTCLGVANSIINAFDRNKPSTLAICREVAKKILPDAKPENKRDALVSAIGHCHIDTAWLWSYAETRRKVARSWATQLDLMDRYPEHRFAASQAQQFKWLKEDYPSLFERVTAKIKAKQFIPVGGSWVESDTNIPSGESLARQLIYGQSFFQAEFGIRCKTFWLPDTFGYAAQLPQLLRLANLPYFFTQKLSWNNINKFPNSTFNWVGLDNSQVLCHMAPTETYNAQVTATEMQASVTSHANLGEDHHSLLLFGNGDGGGGPIPAMLERVRRFQAISDANPSVPRVAIVDSVDEFFEGIERRTDNGKNLVSWHGELYLELHRGTYTSQAAMKLRNRRAEGLLREVEYLCTMAYLLKRKDYPAELLKGIWEDVLLCQFHDVLPGSSIQQVYEDTNAIYASVEQRGEEVLNSVLASLGLDGQSKSILNTLPWPRSEIIYLEDVSKFPTAQASQQGGYVAVDSGGLGVSATSNINFSPVSAEKIDDTYILQNCKVRIAISGGAIVSLKDRDIDRELLPEGKRANRMMLFDDQPLDWDAWDVEVHHLEKYQYLEPGRATILENGPLRASIKVDQRISEESWIIMIISLNAVLEGQTYTDGFNDAVSMVQIDCMVEWREDRKMLKVEFPWNLQSSMADYETQFGIIARPTHFNTTWDSAKFEVVCHRFTNLDEFGYGVAILNDSKYGFATHGNVQRLSLLRSSKAPDATADMGRHHFRYAILPHRGTLRENAIVRAGFNFNTPLRLVPGCVDLPKISLSGAPNIILETIKKAESSADIIFRAYEAYGGEARADIHVDFDVGKVSKVNLLEDELEELHATRSETGFTICVCFKPFEIITLRLSIAH